MATYTQENLATLAKAQEEIKKEYKFKTRAYALASMAASLAMLAAAVATLMAFVFNVYSIYGDGMEPAVKDGHYAVTNRLAYIAREPKRGDVIISDGHMYRIIGLPGEKIEIYGGHVYIDDKLAEEDYLAQGMITTPVYINTAYTVPEDAYYVLSDNRKCFDDSRQGFAISRIAITDKVLFIL
ncbi:signal peptidase I LepB4 (plasmid) [Butyrivibrio proteoclasticus B316]|uniref:Signal peptidase I n=1 Tax=Butyrivibrio proteoclasticus (strain ATCC 51982 / DSM 14932 / B316) TaxID=515622 RepID=E0S4B5_BUTPB|nr:signal peptidase I [Butyrivibrio proteoclasticus]ADL36247.1 signal peptidase I LepB4 [Butyrivibrio proteoclasticus B316]